MTNKETVGFVGLGIMGLPMSLNLIKAGYPLVVYNRTRCKTAEPASKSAAVADTPKEVAQRSSVVITMVADSPDVEEVVLGENGVIEGIQDDAIVIDMSSIAPSVTRHIGGLLAEKGAHMLDAPVSGSSWAAADGTLSIMVGGEPEIFQRGLSPSSRPWAQTSSISALLAWARSASSSTRSWSRAPSPRSAKASFWVQSQASTSTKSSRPSPAEPPIPGSSKTSAPAS